MSAALGAASDRRDAPASGSPKPLQALGSAAFSSFDCLLKGMLAAGQGIEALCLFLGLTREVLDDHLARLGLARPRDKPLRRAGPSGWSVLDTIRLIIWRLAGVHPEVIGIRFGRSAGAVRAKCRRLGVPVPPRRSLFKPDPWSLQDPEPGLTLTEAPWLVPVNRESLCGRAAEPANFGSNIDAVSERAEPTSALVAEPAPVPRIPASVEEAAVPPASRPVAEPVAVPEVTIPVEDAAVPALAAVAVLSASAPPTEIAEWRRETAIPELPRRSVRNRSLAGAARRAGQRELPLLDVVAGSLAGRAENAVAALPTDGASSLPPIPRTIEEVDLGGDLTWFARVRRPLTSKVAVWTCFMMVMGGLYWKEIAKRLGVTTGAYRSFRTRAGVPVDQDRRKAGIEFCEPAARATLEQSGYVLRQALDANGDGTRNWFWVHKSNRATHCSPARRKRESYEPRSDLITILIDAASGKQTRSSRVDTSCANERSMVDA